MSLLETCFDRADFFIQEAEQIALPEPKKQIPSTKWKSVRKKTRELYAKAIQSSPDNEFLRRTSNFMQEIINSHDGPRILVNLFPADDGYSITLMKNDGACAESLHMPYEEGEILDYIDHEQLPPILVDTLHRQHPNAFIYGSLLTEIRDYRISADQFSFESKFILLKPTQQTLNNDVNIIVEETSGSFKWGVDDKLALESFLTLATTEPLCLDTSPSIAIIKNKIHTKRGRFNARPMRKLLRRKGVLAHRRAKVFQSRPTPSSLKLHDFLSERKRLKKEHTQSLSPDVKLPKSVVDVWRKEPLLLTSPVEIDASEFLSALSCDNVNSEDIIEVQSILLESESGNRDVISRITIGQRPRDMHYFGMLQSNKYFKLSKTDAEYTNQIFSLGTEHRANLYILQYHELFTEDGRRPVKVTVRHVNKPPVVYHVPNQQQPWQLSQEKSVYSVGSVINIPQNKWKRMVATNQELKQKILQQQLTAMQKQKAQQKLQQANANANQLSSTTPTLNAITLQSPTQNVFNFQGNVIGNQRLTKTKSISGTESSPAIPQIHLARTARLSSDNFQNVQNRQQSSGAQPSNLDASRTVITKGNNVGVSPQTITMNSSALASALGQIGSTVNVQVPVMTANVQRNSNESQDRQPQGTTTVLRMPIGIGSSNSNSTGQIATLNLISGGQTVLGNIFNSGSGNITIPASQLSSNIAMQLTSIANGANQQQISLVATSTATAAGVSTTIQPQQISLVNQSGNATPFTILANSDNWLAQDSGNTASSQQTLTISPRTQIVPTVSRPAQGPQTQPVQLVQQLRIPAHLLSQFTGANANERLQQFIASQVAAKNAKKRS